MNWIYYLFFIIIMYIIYRIFIYENFLDNGNIYLTKTQLEKTLINNNDKYYNTFNYNDYKVRNINNIEEYYNIIQYSCINISSKYSDILDTAINIANSKIKNININGFNGIKSTNIQWIIGIFKDKYYENGLPHTRNLVIVLPEYILSDLSLLVKVLIHEKIHIYQKLYPEDIKIWLNDNNFIKYKIKEDSDNSRANPDIDNYLYQNHKGEVLVSIYNDNPLTINDVTYHPINEYKYEHPYEYMAYTLENIITNN